MPFEIEKLEKLLPPELSGQKKTRLIDNLQQFCSENKLKDKYYNEFYSTQDYAYFLQGDTIKDIRFPKFNIDTKAYEKKYYDVILISNTCDMNHENPRNVKKDTIISKLIPLNNFVESLSELGVTKAADIVTQVKNQSFSNVIYFPPNKEDQEFIIYLDELSWISSEELDLLKEDINENRISTLDFWGYYLFIFKLSYHFCRLPEETHR